MDYKEKVIALLNSQELTKEQKEKLENIFPELNENESEDERIKKAIIRILKGETRYVSKEDTDRYITWLEKQGEQKKVSIWKHWKNGIAGNGEGRQVYLIRTGNTYDLSSCLGFECDYIELSELDNLMLEKQGEKKPTDKAEPKFKVGDWITDGDYTWEVTDIAELDYVLRSQDGNIVDDTISYVDKEFNLWTIEDAKDGDVLMTTKPRNCPFIYRKTDYNNNLAYYYAGVDGNGAFCEGCLKRTLYHFGSVADITPATKEQRALLFQKMKEAEYKWDSEKKELKKIEPKKLDADKVIAWLVANICDFEYYVKLFKEDFGL